VCVSISLSFSVSLYMPICVCVSLYVYLYLSVSLSLSPNTERDICTYVNIHIYIECVCVCVYLTLFVCIIVPGYRSPRRSQIPLLQDLLFQHIHNRHILWNGTRPLAPSCAVVLAGSRVHRVFGLGPGFLEGRRFRTEDNRIEEEEKERIRREGEKEEIHSLINKQIKYFDFSSLGETILPDRYHRHTQRERHTHTPYCHILWNGTRPLAPSCVVVLVGSRVHRVFGLGPGFLEG